jgi:hypothetical protein
MSSAEATYQATAGNGSYGTLPNLMSQTLVDSVLGSGAKSGYNFTVDSSLVGPPAQFFAYALPQTTSGVGQTGTRRFAIAEDGVLRGDTTLTAPAAGTAGRAAVALINPVGN